MLRPWRTSCEASAEPHWLVPATISEPRRGGPVMPDAPEYTPRSVYTLEPHADLVTAENGYIPIEAIAERVYGKPYSSLRGCQRDDQHIGNDSVKLYELTSDEDYLQALDDLDNAEIYLGWDSRTGESLQDRHDGAGLLAEHPRRRRKHTSHRRGEPARRRRTSRTPCSKTGSSPIAPSRRRCAWSSPTSSVAAKCRAATTCSGTGGDRSGTRLEPSLSLRHPSSTSPSTSCRGTPRPSPIGWR